MDDPFFENSYFLWPRRGMPLSSFREDFLHRRAQIMQNPEQKKKQDVSLTLDTRGFSPEDVSVTVSGRRLEVMAGKRAEKNASSSSAESQAQEFVQAVQLPDHLDPASLTCSLGEDGLLHIETPEESKDESSEEHVVPIRFRTSLTQDYFFEMKNEGHPRSIDNS